MIDNLKETNFEDVLGQELVKKELKSALIMNRHIIIVGPPGIGKTTLARNIARLLPEIEVVMGCEFNCSPKNPVCPECKSKKDLKKIKIKGEERFIRIQGSPDLTAEDLLGDIDPIKALKSGPLSLEAFTPGKIFKANNGILFFDEVNRCPEKLQNALLQVLQEGKATLGSYDVDIPANFIFIGTMNPEDFSTERLSDVFVDRFDFVYMGYPQSLDIEREIVKKQGKKIEVDFPENLLDLSITFIRELRDNDNLEKHPSVRASLGLYERAQSNCLLDGRKKVNFKDIKDAVVSVVSHRIKLKPSVKYIENPKNFIVKEFSKHLDEHEEKGGDG
jgi:magnesium chelatase subunit I